MGTHHYQAGELGPGLITWNPKSPLWSGDQTRVEGKPSHGFCVFGINYTMPKCIATLYPSIDIHHTQDGLEYKSNRQYILEKTARKKANTERYAIMKVDPTKLDYGRDFSMENIQRLFASIGDSWFFKLVLGGIFTINDWIFHPRHETIEIVMTFIMLDTLTGVLKAYKNHQISSSGFFRLGIKIVIYTILLSSGALLDKLVDMSTFFSALTITGTFLATTEAISILENVSALGFKTPKKLLSVLKFVQEESDDSLDRTKKS